MGASGRYFWLVLGIHSSTGEVESGVPPAMALQPVHFEVSPLMGSFAEADMLLAIWFC